jgi:tRNA(His) guanylyltransferase
MKSNDSIGDRMKMYESIPRASLTPKIPVMMRLDGKAFHTLTRGMKRPVDLSFQAAMRNTARKLCEEIQGTRVAYVQSDEITLLLVDYQSIHTQAWFGYDVQKMCSVAAGIASATFTSLIREAYPELTGVFDCRVWNLPEAEVVNCFVWRQQDAVRNSIQSLAQAHFSQKQLFQKDQAAMQDMLVLQKGVNWNDCPVPQKRGVCIVKEKYEVPSTFATASGLVGENVTRTRWVIDFEIPTFTQDRDYIQRFVDVEQPAEEAREAS